MGSIRHLSRLLAALSFGAIPQVASAAPAYVETHTAAPNVLVVVLADSAAVRDNENMGDSSSFTVNQNLASWGVEDSSTSVSISAIHRYTVPYDEDKKDDNKSTYLITVHHRMYLVLGQSLQEGHTYTVSLPSGYGGPATMTFSSTSTFCESIKVNQAGYHAKATSRFANLGVFMGDGGTMQLTSPTYDIYQEGSSTPIASGLTVDAAKDVFDDRTKGYDGSSVVSGEYVYRLRLATNIAEGGPYFISVRGFGRSRSFGVGQDYSRELAKVVTRGLYHQRCGIALETTYTPYNRAACHTKVYDGRADVNNHDMPIPIPSGAAVLDNFSGGYHDAADFDRRPMHTIIPLLMLTYFDAFPDHFIDGQYNIPESGNGIPDFLDEALWGLKVWENLQITDSGDAQYGAVRPGTGDAQPEYGVTGAATDNIKYTTYAVNDANVDFDMGHMGVDTTALCAGIFAQAARLLAPYGGASHADVQAHVDSLLQRAKTAWSYVATKFSLDDSASNKNVQRARYIYAALQLFLATGDETYHRIFKNAANAVIVKGGSWPEQYLPGNTSAACQTAHFASYLIEGNHRSTTDDTLVQSLKNAIFDFADNGTYMGPGPETQPYPQGVTKYMAWGAATAQGRYADPFIFAYLFTSDATKKQKYFNAASQYADYSLGLNPMGISYFSGLKEYFAGLGGAQYAGLVIDEVQSPLHLDSYFTKYGVTDGVSSPSHAGQPIGNVPGILVYGPEESGSGAGYQVAVSNQSFPVWDDLPQERRWGDGWSLVDGQEFTTWETLVWAAVLHGFLYSAGGASVPPVCGNNVCETGESTATCPQDCRVVDSGVPGPDASTPGSDAKPGSDTKPGSETKPGPDSALADAAKPGPDGAVADATKPGPDAANPQADSATPGPDTALLADAAKPGADTASPKKDAASSNPDTARTDGAATTKGSSSGCSCTTARDGKPTSLLALLLLGLLLGRKRGSRSRR